MGSTYTWDDIRQHTSPGDLWLVIDKKGYDVSHWMDEHPGGPEILLQEAGKDATLFLADGDALDTPTQVTAAWIQGRQVELNDRHKRLFRKYEQKYEPR